MTDTALMNTMRKGFEEVRDCSRMDFMGGKYYVQPYPEDNEDIPADDLNRDWELWQAAYAHASKTLKG